MKTTRTYYEILGLPRGATDAQIKRRYKQLVRKYHPDVAADKDTAHRLFIQIREAYEILGDPARRKNYDNELEQRRLRAEQSAKTASNQQFARPPQNSVSQLIKDAQFSFIQKRFQEASSLCKAALRQDPRNARAYAILGDIYRAQGKTAAAIKHYSYAMQFNPSDRETEKKLTSMMGSELKSAVRSRTRQYNPAKTAIANMIGWGIVFFIIMMAGVMPGKPVPEFAKYVPPISLWSWNLVIVISAASVVIGILLSLNKMVLHPDDELILDSGGNWAVIPTGLMLMIGSGLFFLAAAGFYMVIGLMQNSISRSVMTVFVFVAVVVGLASLTYIPAARSQVLLFGGNISFLSMLFGWYIGVMIKPLGEE